MELAPTIFSAGWASGVNAYATVLLLGILGRAGVGDVPEPLTRDSVLALAALMYAIEFVTDKVPYLDNTWDLIHTAIRPAIGSAVGIEFADLDGASELGGAAGGGTTALASHGVKTGLRLAVNISPEPLSNIVVSLLEDMAVAGVVVLALENPEIAAVVAAVLLATGIVLVILLARVIRRSYARWRRQRGGRAPPDPPGG